MLNPAASKDHAMFGNVKSNNVRRPKVSIVQIAGLDTMSASDLERIAGYSLTHQAKTKLTRPKPKDAIRASLSVAPAARKSVEL